MTKQNDGAVVHFLDGEAPRRFETLNEALSFLTTFCPEHLRATAWIVSEGELIDAPAIRKLQRV